MVTVSLLALLCGALYEAACVGWVHFSERGKPLHTAVFSMFAAGAEVTGILDAAHDLRVAPFFVLGYGLGTYCAVRWKESKARV
jgi:hypothetical protein